MNGETLNTPGRHDDDDWTSEQDEVEYSSPPRSLPESSQTEGRLRGEEATGNAAGPSAPISRAPAYVDSQSAEERRQGQTESEFPWGLFGVTNRWQQLEQWSQQGTTMGIVRTMRAGVAYEPPPLPPIAINGYDSVWTLDRHNPQFARMKWAAKPNEAVSLRQLIDRLGKQPPSSSTDARLQQLDTVALELLAIVKHLHSQHYGLGFLCPENVIWVPFSTGRAQLVLPDLGFLPSRPDEPPPAWLRQSCYADEWNAKQARSRSGLPAAEQAAAVQHDMQQLCAILDEVLAVGPLSRRLQGERISSLDDLQQRLKEYSLSQRFFGERSRRIARQVAQVGAVLLLLVLLSFGYMYRQRIGKLIEGAPSVPAEKSALPVDGDERTEHVDPSKLASLVARFDKAEFGQQANLLEELYALSDEGLADELRAKINLLRQRHLDACIKAVEAAMLEMQQTLEQQRPLATLQQIRRNLERLAGRPAHDPQLRERENQCLDYLKRLEWVSQ